MKDNEMPKAGELKQTVSLKGQTVLTRLLDAVSVYNIDISNYAIYNDILEYVDGKFVSLLGRFQAPTPCPMELFIEDTCKCITNDADRKKLTDYFNQDRLLKAYAQEEYEQSLEYEIFLGDGKKHNILHKMILTKDDAGSGIIARCGTRDVSELVEFGRSLNIANNEIDLGIGVIEGLVQDCSVIWLLDVKDHTMKLFRTLEKGYLPGAVDMGLELGHYDAILKGYVEKYVTEDEKERVLREADLSQILPIVENKGICQLDYKRYDENGKESYRQLMVVKPKNGKPAGKYIVAFRDIDDLINAAKEREKLITLSETDMMTNVLNRGSGEKKAGQLISNRKAGMLCILDIDKFKSINDTYGHAVGDKVIIEVAKCLKVAFRERDIVFRLGGDEFSVFAVGDISEENARKIFDRFFDKVDEISIPEIGDRKISISAGAILIDANGDNSFEDLYKKADSCVYDSKDFCGNTVTFYAGQ